MPPGQQKQTPDKPNPSQKPPKQQVGQKPPSDSPQSDSGTDSPSDSGSETGKPGDSPSPDGMPSENASLCWDYRLHDHIIVSGFELGGNGLRPNSLTRDDSEP